MKTYFDHERLNAYQAALEFAAWAEPLLGRLAKTAAVHNQLDRARTSIVLNIAEGNAKYTAPDRCRYFDSARGSAVECAACLDLLAISGQLSPTDSAGGKEILVKAVNLLVGLIKSLMPDRFGEEEVQYRVPPPENPIR